MMRASGGTPSLESFPNDALRHDTGTAVDPRQTLLRRRRSAAAVAAGREPPDAVVADFEALSSTHTDLLGAAGGA